MDAVDREIVRSTQSGLALTTEPYHAVAASVGISTEELLKRIEVMLAAGHIRRIGVVPNHYRLGYQANGMSVWDVSDVSVDELGPKVGSLDFVSHCYRRPRRLPLWPYNLFAMVHGRDRNEVEAKVDQIAEILGEDSRAHDVLYSTRILKKTGLRLGAAVRVQEK